MAISKRGETVPRAPVELVVGRGEGWCPRGGFWGGVGELRFLKGGDEGSEKAMVNIGGR